MADRTCRRCGAVIPNVRANRKRTYCVSCHPPIGTVARCIACGDRFTRGMPSQILCSRLCGQRFAYVTQVKYRNCLSCDRLFTTHGYEHNRTSCSPECLKKLALQRSREEWRRNYETIGKPLARKNRALRRARQSGVETEAFTHEQVFERDGWRCHLCRKPVPKTARFPHPQSAALDHIIPISLGGPHTLANVATAHQACNGSKGNRPAGEQLRLIG